MTRPAARRPGGPPLVIDVITLFPDVIAPFASASSLSMRSQ